MKITIPSQLIKDSVILQKLLDDAVDNPDEEIRLKQEYYFKFGTFIHASIQGRLEADNG